MSREIEFRLWIHDKRNKKGNMYYAKDFGGSQAKLLSYWENRCIVGEDFLEQYTGLKDKTKWEDATEEQRKGYTKETWNGVKIFEGDRLKCWDWGREPNKLLTVSTVFWAEGSWCLDPDPTDGDRYDLFRNIEVIGNIHEEAKP